MAPESLVCKSVCNLMATFDLADNCKNVKTLCKTSGTEHNASKTFCCEIKCKTNKTTHAVQQHERTKRWAMRKWKDVSYQIKCEILAELVRLNMGTKIKIQHCVTNRKIDAFVS